jgi:IS5 family transposase
MTPGGQRHYSDLAIETALTLRALFGLALGQTEGLIGAIMQLLEIDLPVPDHTTLSRRACGLKVQRKIRTSSSSPLHLIVDSTGLKLRGAGEWLSEKHGASRRRAWRKLHIDVDAGNGEIVAFDLTDKDVDDAAHVGSLLEQLSQDPASFAGDGAYGRSAVDELLVGRNPDTIILVPPCRGAVPGPDATSSPSQRDRHVLAIQARGRMHWRKTSGYNRRSKVEAAIGRYKRVIGDALKSRADARRKTEGAIAVKVLNRMREFDQAEFARTA